MHLSGFYEISTHRRSPQRHNSRLWPGRDFLMPPCSSGWRRIPVLEAGRAMLGAGCRRCSLLCQSAGPWCFVAGTVWPGGSHQPGTKPVLPKTRLSFFNPPGGAGAALKGELAWRHFQLIYSSLLQSIVCAMSKSYWGFFCLDTERSA